MTLTSVGLARSLWFLDINEFNPRGKDIFKHLLPPLVEEYKFKTYPKPGGDFSQGMKFENGEFAKEDGTVLVVNCTILLDGVAADTFSSTAETDQFLTQLFDKLPPLGFVYSPEMISRKQYLSQLTVRTAKPLRMLNPKLADFEQRISASVPGTTFEFAAVEFWADQTLVFKPAGFSVQRKIGDPLNSNRYWSQAALQTDTHLTLLNEFEELLLA